MPPAPIGRGERFSEQLKNLVLFFSIGCSAIMRKWYRSMAFARNSEPVTGNQLVQPRQALHLCVWGGVAFVSRSAILMIEILNTKTVVSTAPKKLGHFTGAHLLRTGTETHPDNLSIFFLCPV